MNPYGGAFKAFIVLTVLHFAGAYSCGYILKAPLLAA